MGNQNFNEPVFVVLHGHYESVSSASQTDPNAARTIIRIIGCDNNGYWLDSDGKRYTESDLQHNWVALDTVPTLNKPKKQTALFRGFKPTPDPTQPRGVQGQAYYKEIPEFGEDPDDIAGISKSTPGATNGATIGAPPHDMATNGISAPERPLDNLQRPNASNRTRKQIEQESSKFNEIDFLLNKAHIDVLNQQSQENYGISKYKPTVIQLNLEFEIPYDLSKIQQIIELFNLKPIDVVNYLYQSVEYPEASIKQKLKNLLIPDAPLGATTGATTVAAPMEASRPTFEPPKTVLYTSTGATPDDIAGIGEAPTGRTSGTTPERSTDTLQRPNASKSTEKKKPNFFDF